MTRHSSFTHTHMHAHTHLHACTHTCTHTHTRQLMYFNKKKREKCLFFFPNKTKINLRIKASTLFIKTISHAQRLDASNWPYFWCRALATCRVSERLEARAFCTIQPFLTRNLHTNNKLFTRSVVTSTEICQLPLCSLSKPQAEK